MGLPALDRALADAEFPGNLGLRPPRRAQRCEALKLRMALGAASGTAFGTRCRRRMPAGALERGGLLAVGRQPPVAQRRLDRRSNPANGSLSAHGQVLKQMEAISDLHGLGRAAARPLGKGATAIATHHGNLRMGVQPRCQGVGGLIG